MFATQILRNAERHAVRIGERPIYRATSQVIGWGAFVTAVLGWPAVPAIYNRWESGFKYVNVMKDN